MPRVNRVTRALNNSNPLVSCIMMLQEAENFLRRRLLRCRCPELEAELTLLQEELQVLRDYRRRNDITLEALNRGMRNLTQCCTDLRNSLYTSKVGY